MSGAPRQDSLRITEGTNSFWPNIEVKPKIRRVLTAFGIDLLSEYKYLRGLPVMRAVHDATHKSERVQRHENAPRPSLPDSIRSALHYDELDPDESVLEDESAISTLREDSLYADAVPAAPDSLNENADGDRTLGELF